MGIAYDYAERIKEESIGDASKVATEAYRTLGYRKTATPAKSRIIFVTSIYSLGVTCGTNEDSIKAKALTPPVEKLLGNLKK